MDGLDEETWDVVIAGTSLSQALLALSLSRSGLKVLHVDKHTYYGGEDAGLSLDEAQTWAEEYRENGRPFSYVRIERPPDSGGKLKASRAYTLSIKPQIIYASSPYLTSLITSRIHNQIEFLAVGSWWIHRNGNLQRIPSTREDVFADESLSRGDKMKLMKFLRYVVQEQEQSTEAESQPAMSQGLSMRDVLSSKFKISSGLQAPLSALALAQQSANVTPFDDAVKRIRRHMTSMNWFGPGFAAIYPKYAGNAEIVQVACRAGAVGGAIYLLGQGIESVEPSLGAAEDIGVQLTNGTHVRARYVVGGHEDLPSEIADQLQADLAPKNILNLVAIVNSSLRHLFPPTSDNTLPAVAIVLLEVDQQEGNLSPASPLYLQIHSEDTGECPPGQCIIYASMHVGNSTSEHERYASQIGSLLRDFLSQQVIDVQNELDDGASIPLPGVLWSMSYVSSDTVNDVVLDNSMSSNRFDRIIAFPPRGQDIALDDQVLDSVKNVWAKIVGPDVDKSDFMRFSDRTQEDEE